MFGMTWEGISRQRRAWFALGALLSAACAYLVVSAPWASSPTFAPASIEAKVAENYAKQPLSFQPNAGRTDRRADFISYGADHTLFLTGAGAVLNLATDDGSHGLRLGLASADSGARPVPLEQLPGKVNHMVGDRSSWRTGIPTYERVRYQSVYPGIDVDWYGRQSRLEYDFRVAPGADPDLIALETKGASDLRLAANGDLLIEVPGRTIRQRAPIAYQEIEGRRRSVEASYEIHGKTASFRLGAYDPSRPLVIDPLVFLYSGLLGGASGNGSADDVATDVAFDAQGAAYVTGSTRTTDFPFTLQGHPGDTAERTFVTKLSFPSGNMVYSTVLGGTGGGTIPTGIDVSSGGLPAIVGQTNSTAGFPMGNGFLGTVAPFDSSYNGAGDAFILQLKPDGTLRYGTYIGTAGTEFGQDVAYDAAEQQIIFTSDGDTTGMPTTPTGDGVTTGEQDGFDTTHGLSSDVYIGRLDLGPDAGPHAANRQITYGSYFGFNGSDSAGGLDVAPGNNIYLTGSTGSTNMTLVGQVEGDQGQIDAYVARLDLDDGALGLDYSTYLGGSFTDGASAIAVDPTDSNGDKVWLAGSAKNGAVKDFPTTGGSYDPTANGTQDNVGTPDDDGDVTANIDGFFTKLDTGAAPENLIYSSFLRHNPDDHVSDLALDGGGDPYITGTIVHPDFVSSAGERIGGPINGDWDNFLALFDADGVLVMDGNIGGSGAENANGVAVDPLGNPIVVGMTLSSDFPRTSNGYQQPYKAGRDAYVTKVLFSPTIDGSPLNIYANGTGRIGAYFDGEGFERIGTQFGLPVSGLTLLMEGSTYGSFGTLPFKLKKLPKLTGPGQITSVYAVESLKITEVIDYAGGDNGFTTTYSIKNESGSDVSFRAYVGADMQPAGDDLGVGRYDTIAPRFISALTDPYQTGDGLVEASPWTAAQEGGLGAISSKIAGGGILDNTVDGSNHDTAVAAQWDNRTGTPLLGGATETISTRWEFKRVPPPINGQKVVVGNAGGIVLVKAPGQANFFNLTDPRRIPIGSLIDVNNGFVDLTAEATSGANETGTFWDGMFQVEQAQTRQGGAVEPLTATLADPVNCKGGKGKKKKKKGKKSAVSSGARASAGGTRQLWGRAKGSFRTKGYRGSATVRGTEWLTTDRCNGKDRTTTFRVVEGLLSIDVFAKKGAVNKILGPGKPFTATNKKDKKDKRKGKKK